VAGPGKAEPKGSRSGGEHGSVLAEFVGKEKDPKQLTVAGKGNGGVGGGGGRGEEEGGGPGGRGGGRRGGGGRGGRDKLGDKLPN
jgi:hypothetical protein